MAEYTREFLRWAAELQRQKPSRGPQLGFSSIEDGSVDEYDADGNLTSSVGKQFDGSHGAFTLNGPKPATPAAPTLTAGVGTLTVHTAGGYADPELRAPLTFGLRQVHASREPVFIPTADTLVGSITDAAGGSKTFARESGTWYVGLVEKSNFGRLSDLSATVAGVPLEVPGAEVNDGTPPPVLAAPTVTDWLGQLYVASDGLGAAGESMPEDYSHSIVESAPAATGPWTAFGRLVGEDSMIPPGIPYETETWFRLRSVDQWGNTSDPSATTSGTTHRLVGGDLADDTISAGKLKTNEIWADAGWLGKARIGVLNVDTASGSSLDFDDINGLIVTGALIQTLAAPNRGIKLDRDLNALLAYDLSGMNTFLLDGESGDFSAIGDFSTGMPGLAGITIRPGLSSLGLGQSVIEVRSGSPTETRSGEIFTISDGDLHSDNLSMQIWSPQRGTGSGSGRVSLQMFSGTSGTAPSAYLGSTASNGALLLLSGTGRAELSSPRGIQLDAGTGAEGVQVGGGKIQFDSQHMALGKAFIQADYPIRFSKVNSTVGQTIEANWLNIDTAVKTPEVQSATDLYLAARGAIHARMGSDGSGGFIQSHSTYDRVVTYTANVHIGGDHTFTRTTSARRYKIDPQPMYLPDSLLDIEMKDWLDRSEVELHAWLSGAPRPFTEEQAQQFGSLNLRRVPGNIAEEVEALGGEPFVEYGPDGRTESLAYDRLAMARTGVQKRQHDQLRVEFEQFKTEVSQRLALEAA